MSEEEKSFFGVVNRPSDPVVKVEEVQIDDSHKKNLYKIIILSLLFLLLYTSAGAFQNMISQIYFQMGYDFLGNLTLVLNCFSLSFSSIFAPFFAHFFSFKTTMFICSFAFIFSQLVGVFTAHCSEETNENRKYYFVLCNEEFIFFLNLFAAVILGFFAVILWICQCGYTTNLCDEKNKSFFFGIFSSIFQISIFSGSLLTICIMKMFQDHFIFFLVCLVITFITALSFLGLPDVPTGDFIQNEGFVKKVKDVFKIFLEKDKKQISAVAAFCGLELGFWIGNLYRLVEETLSDNVIEEEVNVRTAWVLACLGIFEILGGILSSIFGDKFQKLTLVIYANILIFFSFLMGFLLLYSKYYLICFLIAGMLGIGDCMLQIMLNAMVSTTNNNIMHFSHYIIIQNFFLGLSIVFGLLLNSLYDLILMIVLQIILFIFTIIFK